MAAWLKDQLLFRWQQLQLIVDLDLHKIPVPSSPLETQTVCAQAISTNAFGWQKTQQQWGLNFLSL
jgi:hypothetical protein